MIRLRRPRPFFTPALPPDERDPDRVEADARARVDEAIAHLAGWA